MYFDYSHHELFIPLVADKIDAALGTPDADWATLLRGVTYVLSKDHSGVEVTGLDHDAIRVMFDEGDLTRFHNLRIDLEAGDNVADLTKRIIDLSEEKRRTACLNRVRSVELQSWDNDTLTTLRDLKRHYAWQSRSILLEVTPPVTVHASFRGETFILPLSDVEALNLNSLTGELEAETNSAETGIVTYIGVPEHLADRILTDVQEQTIANEQRLVDIAIELKAHPVLELGDRVEILIGKATGKGVIVTVDAKTSMCNVALPGTQMATMPIPRAQLRKVISND